jgi:hypothetical protein
VLFLRGEGVVWVAVEGEEEGAEGFDGGGDGVNGCVCLSGAVFFFCGGASIWLAMSFAVESGVESAGLDTPSGGLGGNSFS